MEPNYLHYFLPDRQAISRAQYRELNLDHLSGTSPQHLGVSKGPNGGQGLCFIPKVSGDGRVVSARYLPEEQEWTCCADGKLWIGWTKGMRPGPNDLQRYSAYDTYVPVRLRDGCEWDFTPTRALPQSFGYDGTGTVVMRRLPENGVYYDASLWLLDVVVNRFSGYLWIDILERLSLLLSLNYRVGLHEVLALNLFTQQEIVQATFAALNMLDLYEEGKKKETAAATSDSGSGETEDSPDTSLTGATST